METNRRNFLKTVFALGASSLAGCSFFRNIAGSDLAEEARKELAGLTRDVNEVSEAMEPVFDNFAEMIRFYTSDQVVGEELSSGTVVIDAKNPEFSQLMLLHQKVASLEMTFRDIKTNKRYPTITAFSMFNQLEVAKVPDATIAKALTLISRCSRMMEKAEEAGIVVNDMKDIEPEEALRALTPVL